MPGVYYPHSNDNSLGVAGESSLLQRVLHEDRESKGLWGLSLVVVKLVPISGSGRVGHNQAKLARRS